MDSTLQFSYHRRLKKKCIYVPNSITSNFRTSFLKRFIKLKVRRINASTANLLNKHFISVDFTFHLSIFLRFDGIISIHQQLNQTKSCSNSISSLHPKSITQKPHLLKGLGHNSCNALIHTGKPGKYLLDELTAI